MLCDGVVVGREFVNDVFRDAVDVLRVEVLREVFRDDDEVFDVLREGVEDPPLEDEPDDCLVGADFPGLLTFGAEKISGVLAATQSTKAKARGRIFFTTEGLPKEVAFVSWKLLSTRC